MSADTITAEQLTVPRLCNLRRCENTSPICDYLLALYVGW